MLQKNVSHENDPSVNLKKPSQKKSGKNHEKKNQCHVLMHIKRLYRRSPETKDICMLETNLPPS